MNAALNRMFVNTPCTKVKARATKIVPGVFCLELTALGEVRFLRAARVYVPGGGKTALKRCASSIRVAARRAQW